MPQSAYYPPSNSVLPPIPAQCEGKLQFAERSVRQQHLNIPTNYTQNWVITGLFADPSQQKQKTLGKILTCYIDFDLTDTMVHQNMAGYAKQQLIEKGVEQIYRGKQVLPTADLNAGEHAHDLVKAYLSYLPVEQVKGMTAEAFSEILTKHLIPKIGKPSLITYTGHGAHAYYWLDDAEGYTSEEYGVANASQFKKYFKGLFAAVNREVGYQVIDPKVSDLGTRCTREINTLNIKNSHNPKKVVPFMEECTEQERRLRLQDCRPVEQSDMASRIAEASLAAAPRGRGRPPKFRPLAVAFSEEVYVEVNGEQLTMQVSALLDRFDELMAQQGQTDKIRNLRLAQLGEGSMNMFATRSGEGVMFILTASKYMKSGDNHWKQDSSGNFLGYYFYDGTAFELIRNERGAIRKNSSNLQQILTHDPRVAGKLQYNSRLEQVFIHRDLHLDVYSQVTREVRIARNTEWFKLRDAHYITFEKTFNHPYGLDNVSDAQIQRVVKSVAMQRAFDPVTSWIEAIEWDGRRRLDGKNSWLCNLLNLPKEHPKRDLYSAYGRAVMLGIMRNIYTGNTYPDVQHVLTLAGGQGVGKSLAAAVLGLTEVLGMDYFHDSGIDMGAGAHKGDQIASMLGCFLVELPEAISLSSNSTDASIKAFLTTKKDKGRFAFGREHEERLRTTYFVTNSNDNIFLSDHTGNRRYLVVDCFDDLCTRDGRLDIDSLREVLPQLYAEAYERCVVGNIPADRRSSSRIYEGDRCEDWNLTLGERELQAAHNLKFTQPDYIVEELRSILDAELDRGVSCVSYAEIKRKLGERDPTARLSNVKFANAMTRCGWRRATVRGRNVWMPLVQPKKQARERIKPQTPIKPPTSLEEAFAVVEREDFQRECSADALKKIIEIRDAINASTNVLPAQAAVFIRHVDCAVNAQSFRIT